MRAVLSGLTRPLGRVGIVIAAHNAERYLPAAIDSTMRQSLTDWQLVVVDDGSSDQTAAIAGSYAARDTRVLLIRQTNSGVSAARNRGLAELGTSCDYVTFLDADDIWEDDTLRVLVTALEANDANVAAHGLALGINDEGRRLAPDPVERWYGTRYGVVDGRIVEWPADAPTTFEVLILECRIATGSIVIRRRLIDQVGGFDTSLAGNEDWHLWLRLASHGPIACVDRVVLRYRRHETNASHDVDMMGRTNSRVRRRMLQDPELTEEQLSLAHFGLRWSLRNASGIFWRQGAEELRQCHIRRATKCLNRCLLRVAQAACLTLTYEVHELVGSILDRI